MLIINSRNWNKRVATASGIEGSRVYFYFHFSRFAQRLSHSARPLAEGEKLRFLA